MTERLYYTNNRLQQFEARVVSVDGTHLVLDATGFYPTSGGQPHDLGSVNGTPVVDVIDDDTQIVHVLAEPLPADTAHVQGTIDWPRRVDHMQQHTGQHLLSAVFADHFGWNTVSVHFGADYATLDLDVERVAPEAMVRAEQVANALVVDNLAVEVSFEDAATAAGLRKPSDRDGPLRIVTIRGVDRSACGGTHVSATGEIGPILLRRQERMKKLTRIEFVCGARAVARARRDFAALSAMALDVGSSVDELPELVAAQARQLRQLEASVRKLGDDLALYRAREWWERAIPDQAGVRWIAGPATGSAEEQRAFALAVGALRGVVYASADPASRVLLLAASADSGVDAGARIKAALTAVGGRGGGSPRMAQGTAPDLAALRRAWEILAIPLDFPDA